MIGQNPTRALFREYLRRRRSELATDRHAYTEAVAQARDKLADLGRVNEDSRQGWIPGIPTEQEIDP